jgi:putative ABC transport system permease protein
MNDLRYAVRMLLKNPGFSTVILLSLALGIAANTAMFSFVDAIILRPLPLPEPEQLVKLWGTLPNSDRSPVPASDFLQWRQQSQSFQQMVALAGGSAVLAEGDQLEKVRGWRITPEFFPLLGFRTALGRPLVPADCDPAESKVVVLTHRFWERRFHADPHIVGRTVLLNQQSHVVVGVLTPESTFDLGQRDIYTPLVLDPATRREQVVVLGRLKPGISQAAAQSEMNVIARQIEPAFPDTHDDRGVNLGPLEGWFGSPAEEKYSVLVVFAAVVFVQLIVCANVANLLLARATTREKEMTIRAALGASRGRLTRQLLTEGLLLSLIGGALGTVLAVWLAGALTPWMPPSPLRVAQPVALNARVFGFTLGVSILTGMLFGLAPAWQMRNPNLNEFLKEGVRGTCGARRHWLRSLLVVAEVALALVLLVGASLMVQTIWRLNRIAPGFEPRNLGMLYMALPREKSRDDRQRTAFYQEVVERVQSVPGVQHAAITTLFAYGAGGPISVAGRPLPSLTDRPHAELEAVSPDWLATFGIRLLRGRTFSIQDTAHSTRVALINQHLAQRFFAAANPVGEHLLLDPPDGGEGKTGAPVLWEIVGVIPNVKGPGVVTEESIIYVPFTQYPTAGAGLAIRTAGDRRSLVSALRKEIGRIDPDILVDNFDTVERILYRSRGFERQQAWLLSGTAALALVLAAVGIYGVMAYAISQRTREIGIRLALGAQRAEVVGLVVWQGMLPVAAGMALGVGGAWALTRVISSLLYGVSANDPLTFTGVAVLLAFVALLACYLPARRAANVDPMLTLRHE